MERLIAAGLALGLWLGILAMLPDTRSADAPPPGPPIGRHALV